MSRSGKKNVSLINWILTVLVCSIPGVHFLASLLFVIFGRAKSKRRYAAANLIVTGLVALLALAAFVLFPDSIRDAAQWLRDLAAEQLSANP